MPVDILHPNRRVQEKGRMMRPFFYPKISNFLKLIFVLRSGVNARKLQESEYLRLRPIVGR